MTRDAPPEVLSARLGYLLKHAYLRLAEESSRALAPHGIDGRELAVLAVLDAHDDLSQLEAAGKLGIDRTTMVTLVDALEAKELVERRRSPQDRRKNIVQLTPAGRERLRDAEFARQEVERRFLAPLSGADATRLVRALRSLLSAPLSTGQASAPARAEGEEGGPHPLPGLWRAGDRGAPVPCPVQGSGKCRTARLSWRCGSARRRGELIRRRAPAPCRPARSRTALNRIRP